MVWCLNRDGVNVVHNINKLVENSTKQVKYCSNLQTHLNEAVSLPMQQIYHTIKKQTIQLSLTSGRRLGGAANTQMTVQIQISVLLAACLHIGPVELVSVVGNDHMRLQLLDVGHKFAQYGLLVFLVEHLEWTCVYQER